jgi:hypothetical protein
MAQGRKRASRSVSEGRGGVDLGRTCDWGMERRECSHSVDDRSNSGRSGNGTDVHPLLAAPGAWWWSSSPSPSCPSQTLAGACAHGPEARCDRAGRGGGAGGGAELRSSQFEPRLSLFEPRRTKQASKQTTEQHIKASKHRSRLTKELGRGKETKCTRTYYGLHQEEIEWEWMLPG